jgi:hypothetical protein
MYLTSIIIRDAEILRAKQKVFVLPIYPIPQGLDRPISI